MQHIVLVAASYFTWDVYICVADRAHWTFIMHGCLCWLVYMLALVSRETDAMPPLTPTFTPVHCSTHSCTTCRLCVERRAGGGGWRCWCYCSCPP